MKASPIGSDPRSLQATADNLQMTAAAALASGAFRDVEYYWGLLRQYADYLVDEGAAAVLRHPIPVSPSQCTCVSEPW